jgi:hypothetical protein
MRLKVEFALNIEIDKIGGKTSERLIDVSVSAPSRAFQSLPLSKMSNASSHSGAVLVRSARVN